MLDDSALGWIKQEQELFQGGKVLSSTFVRTDYTKIAEGFGIKGYTIEREGELDAVLKEAYVAGEPVVVDVKTITDPEFSRSLHEASKRAQSPR